MSKVRQLAPAVLSALVLAGCGHANVAMAPAKQTVSAVSAKSVSPDDPAVLHDDQRRADYWAKNFGDNAAIRVMSIQTTALNSQKISSAANVFFSPGAFYASDGNFAAHPCVFVARHYMGTFLGQDIQVPDFDKLASGLAAIGSYTVNAPQAWTIAHGWTPAGTTPASCPTAAPCPAASGGPAGKLFFTSSRAFLTQSGTSPIWSLYADKQKFVIDANSGAITSKGAQEDASDPINSDSDVQLQRASQVWLPMSPFQANIQTDPNTGN